jgi:hypothetical protein
LQRKSKYCHHIGDIWLNDLSKLAAKPWLNALNIDWIAAGGD